MKSSEHLEVGTLSRYHLTDYGFRRLQHDCIRFENKFDTKLHNGFITKIVANYIKYANKNFWGSFIDEITEFLNKDKHSAVYSYDDRITVTTELKEELNNCRHSLKDLFKKEPIITYILNKFISLSVPERERIYCLNQYETVCEAVSKNRILTVTLSNGSTYDVKPYDISVDDNSLSYYLMCYSRTDESREDYTCHSIKLTRIKKCRDSGYEFTHSKDEEQMIQNLKVKFGSAYMPGKLSYNKIRKTKIRLTTYGFEELFLKIKVHQRPLPLSVTGPDEKGDYELEFDCSFSQISNYFFSFGKEAEVSEPESVRKWFADRYREAAELYR